jgi:FKBP-type peptidyl-prolyl cis-trans isomerase
MHLLARAAVVMLLAASVRADAASQSVAAPPDVNAAPRDAIVMFSGLAWKKLKPGTGTDRPGAMSTVSVVYTGWTPDGRMFDSSRGAPVTFKLDEVIPGWTEGVRLMVAGEKRRFWIPGALAYDKVEGPPGVPRGRLVFDIELVEIIKTVR